MIIALFGISATGKTTLAREIGAALGLEVRHCGQIVKQALIDLNQSPDNAPDELHRAIDDETAQWTRARGQADCVVEGRFLDEVLALLRPDTHLVHVTASQEVRLARWRTRAGPDFSPARLTALDKADDLFCARLYDSGNTIVADASIDTTDGAEDGWESMIQGMKDRRS